MPVIVPVEWDSRQLGLPVGRLMDFAVDPEDRSMEDYGLVLARVPQQNHRIAARLQDCGFRYVGLDLRLLAKPDESAYTGDHTRWQMRRVSHSARTSRSTVSTSRTTASCSIPLAALDAGEFLGPLIHEHCAEFADVVICAVDMHDHLAGFVSCLIRPPYLEMFLVAVHPAHQGIGLGGVLLNDAAALAREKALRPTTSVMASNVRGFNFYIKHNCLVEDGEIIMHRWQERVQYERYSF